MTGHYTFASPNDLSSFISSGQPGTSSSMSTNLISDNHHYGPTIPCTTPPNISTYQTSNGVRGMSNSACPHAFPMTIPTQEPLYSANNIQSSHIYSQRPDVPAKWPANSPWSSSMISQRVGEPWASFSGMQSLNRQRPKLTTTLWEDENTVCFQVDAKGICVARRQDNDMVNGTKLLNVTGMSRGKRDGILKNEKGRVVVKVGAMHLKGVWIPLQRAKALVAQFKMQDLLFPLLVEDPSHYLYSSPYPSGIPPPRMSLSSESGTYFASFTDPVGSIRGQHQHHYMVNHPRLNYGSPAVVTNDTHNTESLQSRQYPIPYRYPGAHIHTHSSSIAHESQGVETHMISENSRNDVRPLVQGENGQQEQSTAELSHPIMNTTSQHNQLQQSLDYPTDVQYSRKQHHDLHQARKMSEHQFITNPPTDITRKRTFSTNTGAEIADSTHPHHNAVFAPLSGRNYSFSSPLTLSPCSLPSPSMTQIQHDMSPVVNKRPKVLRYEFNPHLGHLDPYSQQLDHQVKPTAASGALTPIGQESLGLIFGTLSPPESETESGFETAHHRLDSSYKFQESTQIHISHEINPLDHVNSIKQLS